MMREGGGAIQVLLAAASPHRRDALESAIRGDPRFHVAGSVVSIASLVMRARALRPAVVLVDLPESQNSFPPLASDLEQIGVAVGVLADEPDAAWAARALRSGVRALLPRDAASADLHSAIEVAHRGMLLLDPDLAQELLVPKITRSGAAEDPPESFEALTAREVEVLRMMAEGLGNKEIAVRLGI